MIEKKIIVEIDGVKSTVIIESNGAFYQAYINEYVTFFNYFVETKDSKTEMENAFKRFVDDIRMGKVNVLTYKLFKSYYREAYYSEGDIQGELVGALSITQVFIKRFGKKVKDSKVELVSEN